MNQKNKSQLIAVAMIAFGATSGLWFAMSSLKKVRAQVPPPPPESSPAPVAATGATGETGSTGAGGATGNTAPTGAPAAEKAVGVIESPAVVKSATLNMNGDQYVYDPAGRRDPFKPFKSVLAQSDGKSNRLLENLQPLERIDLNDLKVIGVIWGTKKPRAVVRDKSGESYIVYKGTKMGKKEGVVSEIRESGITVIEVEYGEGTIAKVPRVMSVSN